MTTAGKRHIVLSLMTFLSCWPLVHRLLVETVDIDPWRFFGFAMYSQPRVGVFLDVLVLAGDQRIDTGTSGLPEAVVQERARAAQRRLVWGRGSRPDRLARLLFDAYPQADGVVLRYRRPFLDRATSRMAALEELYRYGRTATGDVVLEMRE